MGLAAITFLLLLSPSPFLINFRIWFIYYWSLTLSENMSDSQLSLYNWTLFVALPASPLGPTRLFVWLFHLASFQSTLHPSLNPVTVIACGYMFTLLPNSQSYPLWYYLTSFSCWLNVPLIFYSPSFCRSFLSCKPVFSILGNIINLQFSFNFHITIIKSNLYQHVLGLL